MSIWKTLSDTLSQIAAGRRVSSLFGEQPPPERSVAFTLALVGLCAKLSKADGLVSPCEAQAMRNFIHIPDEALDYYDRVFTRAARDADGYKDFARDVAKMFEPGDAVLAHVIEGMISIAQSDGKFHEKEQEVIAEVAAFFHLDIRAFDPFTEMTGPLPRDPYLVLGASPEDDDTALRAKYLTLMKAHHPDVLIGRGAPEEIRAGAETRTQEINIAYEKIRAERRQT